MNDVLSTVQRQPGETRAAFVERITTGPRGRDGLTDGERELLWRLQMARQEFADTFMSEQRRAPRRRNRWAA